jgi:endonuclease-3
MSNLLRVFNLIKKQAIKFTVPSVTLISHSHEPFQVLISCILSLRTKDKTTIEASRRLFQVADNPVQMARLSLRRIEKLIYPVGFFRNKAKSILELSKKINFIYNGKVPNSIEKLLEFKGVGRKTANLVLGLGFNISAICVDIHVHRISNRLGWVKTKTPEETEKALERIVPKKLWIELNTILVAFGQNLCLPVSPWCSKCSVNKFCKKINVLRCR